MKKKPTLEEFLKYGIWFIEMKYKEDGSRYTQWITGKYLVWDAADWHVYPNTPRKKRKILNWKTTLGNCCKWREPNELKTIEVNEPKVIQANFLKDRYGVG